MVIDYSKWDQLKYSSSSSSEDEDEGEEGIDYDEIDPEILEAA